ncbi:pseudouridylate synthase [Holotrichia oblita]|uniref:Pseudouridylate synthase n=1 Tax=Holotrichia oblita TaxID=644536 RepID=A0ACB9TLP2_HOLOL|nr:pseudouridylate synthase [Holotrichia oblita]
MCDAPLIKKQRYDGRTKKRKWEERRTDNGEAFEAKKEKPEERIKRRKYALLLGYSGVDYYGMQRNPTMKTIEEEIFTALLKTGLITEEAFNQIQTIQYQRAARTDKGVSAARQVVSIKLPEIIEVDKINEILPDVIRLFGYKRVTKGFNSRLQCDARTYFYMLPTIAFSKCNEDQEDSFRLSEELFKEINNTLSKFVGTKNYHNFTSKKKANDPSASRYIMSFSCESPFVRNEIEFAVIKVKGMKFSRLLKEIMLEKSISGQSFMLHQIRKMIGLTIALTKGYASEDIFQKVFTIEDVNIPKAPGLGLVLDFVHYDKYNRRYGQDGIHDTLEWKELDDTVMEFKEKYIYPTIIETEIKEASMLNWTRKLSGHRYDLPDEDEKYNEENSYSDGEEDVQKAKA